MHEKLSPARASVLGRADSKPPRRAGGRVAYRAIRVPSRSAACREAILMAVIAIGATAIAALVLAL